MSRQIFRLYSIIAMETHTVTMIVYSMYVHVDTELSARLSQDFSLFQRLSKPNFDHFTSKQKEQVNTVIKSISQRLHDTFGTTYNIEEYNISK